MTRKQQRAVASAALFLFGLILIWLGEDGWEINAIPAQYLGYIVLAVGLAAAFGVNIWGGGVLDPRRDHDADNPSPEVPRAKSR